MTQLKIKLAAKIPADEIIEATRIRDGLAARLETAKANYEAACASADTTADWLRHEDMIVRMEEFDLAAAQACLDALMQVQS
jgi:hypothetical protein